MIRFFPRTIFLVIILAIEFIVIFWNNTTVFLGILIGPASIMLTISGIALYIFRRIEEENKTNMQESKADEISEEEKE